MNSDQASTIVPALGAIVGASHVITDQTEREFFSSDIYSAGQTCACVVRAGNKDELARCVKTATDAGYAVIARGGGMSYSSGYTPTRTQTIIFDMQRMNRILAVNTTDMYVVVEAGVTWKQLYEELKPKGVRTPFFGTLSGIHATVGGAMSQGAMFFGSGQHGSAPESVLGLEVVLADGTLLPTGQAAHKGDGKTGAKPFFRYYGPDRLVLGRHWRIGVEGHREPSPDAHTSGNFLRLVCIR